MQSIFDLGDIWWVWMQKRDQFPMWFYASVLWLGYILKNWCIRKFKFEYMERQTFIGEFIPVWSLIFFLYISTVFSIADTNLSSISWFYLCLILSLLAADVFIKKCRCVLYSCSLSNMLVLYYLEIDYVVFIRCFNIIYKGKI